MWVETVSEAVCDAATGNVTTIVSVSRDITERKHQEEWLRRVEERNRALLRAIPDLMFVINREGVFVDSSTPSGAPLLVPLDRTMGRSAHEVLPPELADATMHNVREALRTGQVQLFEYPLTVRGEVCHFEARTVPCGPDETLSIVREITERKRAEHKLQESRQKLQLLVNQSPLGVVSWSLDFQVTEWNPAAERIFGYRREELIGRRGAEMLVPEHLRGAIEGVFAQLLTRRGGLRSTNQNITKDGRTILCEWYNTPLVDESGNVVGAASLVQDVTERLKAEEERRRLEAQMLHAQKLESLGVLAGGIAHDFNNLLVGMLGNAGLALLELPQGHPARQSVEQIEMVAVRAADLTHQMLAYSGRGKFMIEPVNLSRLVDEMAHLLEVSVSKAAAIHYEFEPDLPPVEADATQMRQIVMNLIINASDALESREGTITVRTGLVHADADYLAAAYLTEELQPGRFVFLEVTDTGRGMDAETSARIFDPFFSTKQTGRGLGLAAVLGIVRGHHGTIRVTSELNKGTTFRVLLPPSVAAEEEDAAKPQHAEPRLGSGTVLVVDDDETVRRVARSILERHGFTVVTANDGVEAVEAVVESPERFSLVLLDMTMPRMSGDEAFLAIKAVRESVPVILSSGYSEQDAVSRFAPAGLAGFVQKPFQVRELMDKVFASLAAR